MTTRQEAVNLLNIMPEDTVEVVVELLRRMHPTVQERKTTAEQEDHRRLGVAKGKFVVPDSIDECNAAIAEMFGV